MWPGVLISKISTSSYRAKHGSALRYLHWAARAELQYLRSNKSASRSVWQVDCLPKNGSVTHTRMMSSVYVQANFLLDKNMQTCTLRNYIFQLHTFAVKSLSLDGKSASCESCSSTKILPESTLCLASDSSSSSCIWPNNQGKKVQCARSWHCKARLQPRAWIPSVS